MFRFLVFVLFASALVSCQRRAAKFEACGGKTHFNYLEVEPCNSDPCVFQTGKSSKVHFSFVAGDNSETLLLNIKFKTWWLLPKLPLGSATDLCKRGVISCPLVKGRTYEGTLPFQVPSLVPSMKGTIYLYLEGDRDESCVNVEVVIK